MRISTVALIGSMSIFAACGVQEEPREVGTTAMNASVEPVLVPGNPDCEDLGYEEEFKVNGGDIPDGTSHFSDGVLDVYVTRNGNMFNWESNIGVDAVIVKGGPNANVYEYDPEATSDTGLHPPFNPNSNDFYGISHISWCYDIELVVTKDAETEFTRDYIWEIEKTVLDPIPNPDGPDLTLFPGDVYSATYQVNLTRSFMDECSVSGNIWISNPHLTESAIIASVVDSVDGTMADVECGVMFPYMLEPQAMLHCTYSADLPDCTDRTNTATVTTTPESPVEGGSGTAPVDFSETPDEEIDECVTVSDTLAGPLEEGDLICGEMTIMYTVDIGPFEECDRTEIIMNTASFVTNDNMETGEDSATVDVFVECPPEEGCTFTIGYWRNHVDEWPLDPHMMFFLSGQSWLEVLNTSPAGNAYYNLARQYIAARLNQENGASVPANVQAALDAATALFSTYTPEEVNASATLSDLAIELAAILAAYNEGTIGPGHCPS